MNRYNLRKRKCSDERIPVTKKYCSEDESADDDDFIDDDYDEGVTSGRKIVDDSEDDISEDIESSNSEEEENQYFEYDDKPLVNIIKKRLIERFPSINEKDLQSSIEFAIKTAEASLKDEYCGTSPKDERWKIGLEEEDIKIIEEQLQLIRAQISAEEPSIPKIINARISQEQKKLAIMYYDIYNNTEPYTEEHLDMRNRILNILSSEIKEAPEEELEFLNKEEKRLAGLTQSTDISQIKKDILKLNTSDKQKAVLLSKFNQMERMSPSSSEYDTIYKQLLWYTSLPYNTVSTTHKILPIGDCESVTQKLLEIKEEMDRELYGLDAVKLSFLSLLNNDSSNSQTRKSIALKGPPGVGKTKIVSVFAKAIGLPMEKIGLGGIVDSSLFKGASGYWVGSEPSIILSILRKIKICNGIILLDEIDKLAASDKGREVQNALLHVSDYTQNAEFCDSYLSDFPHDFSKLWFFYSMNDDLVVDPTLLDRLNIITIEPYKQKELQNIIRDYALPRFLENVGMNKNDCEITECGCDAMIHMYSEEMKDKGVRTLEKAILDMVSKINMHRTTTPSYHKTLPYYIENFQLPLIIDERVVRFLLGTSTPKRTAPFGMYS